MKVGIKKIHENEWRVRLGNASVKMDHFSVALLGITLEHLLALEHGDEHSTLDSYVSLGLRMGKLKSKDLQSFIGKIEASDLLNLMLVANNHDFNVYLMDNMGGILSKQFEADLAQMVMPDEEGAKLSIRRIIGKMFLLEAQGEIEVISEDTEYI